MGETLLAVAQGRQYSKKTRDRGRAVDIDSASFSPTPKGEMRAIGKAETGLSARCEQSLSPITVSI